MMRQCIWTNAQRLWTLAFTVVVCGLSACHTLSTRVEQIPDPQASNDVELARATGRLVRNERVNSGGFVIYPTYLTQADTVPAALTQLDRRTMAVVLQAFRDGAQSRFADTAAWLLPTASTLPDSARVYFTLNSAPSIRGDSGIVNVFRGKLLTTETLAERQVTQYVFVRRNGEWVFVRKALRYAT